MFLKFLEIIQEESIVRKIEFRKGINLIVDETSSSESTVSGNNVGKTTVLRLIDYCLGSSGNNIFQDPEFKEKSNSVVEDYLKNNNVCICLTLKADLLDDASQEIHIKRNFLARKQKTENN